MLHKTSGNLFFFLQHQNGAIMHCEMALSPFFQTGCRQGIQGILFNLPGSNAGTYWQDLAAFTIVFNIICTYKEGE